MLIVNRFIGSAKPDIGPKGRSSRDMAEPARSTRLVVYPARSGNQQANRSG
jgi:hypothetical protein